MNYTFKAMIAATAVVFAIVAPVNGMSFFAAAERGSEFVSNTPGS